MRLRAFLPVAFGMVVCSTFVAQAQTAVNRHPLELANRIGGKNERSFFLFSIPGGTYVARHDGFVEASVPGDKRRVFILKINRGERLDRVYYSDFEGDLLLACETTSGRVFATRIQQRTRRIKWTTSLEGYNLGPGLIDDKALFMSSANKLMRIDLAAGDSIWEVSDLEGSQTRPYTQFRVPQVRGDIVVFEEDEAKPRTIEVERSAGRVLRIK
jgi:hypothetical protein